jgi:hypothetical protein
MSTVSSVTALMLSTGSRCTATRSSFAGKTARLGCRPRMPRVLRADRASPDRGSLPKLGHVAEAHPCLRLPPLEHLPASRRSAIWSTSGRPLVGPRRGGVARSRSNRRRGRVATRPTRPHTPNTPPVTRLPPTPHGHAPFRPVRNLAPPDRNRHRLVPRSRQGALFSWPDGPNRPPSVHPVRTNRAVVSTSTQSFMESGPSPEPPTSPKSTPIRPLSTTATTAGPCGAATAPIPPPTSGMIFAFRLSGKPTAFMTSPNERPG